MASSRPNAVRSRPKAERIDIATREKRKNEQKIKDLKDTNWKLAVKLRAKEKECENLKAERNRYKADLTKERALTSELQEKCREYKKQIRDNTNHIKELTRKNTQLQEELEELRDTVSIHSTQLDDLKEQFKRFSSSAIQVNIQQNPSELNQQRDGHLSRPVEQRDSSEGSQLKGNQTITVARRPPTPNRQNHGQSSNSHRGGNQMREPKAKTSKRKY